MKIGILSKRTTMLAGKLKEYLESYNHEVKILTLKDLVINETLLERDYYILKSKQLFFLYAGFFLEANNIPIYPNPSITYKHKNRIEAHFLMKRAGLATPDYYFGSYQTLIESLNNTNFPLLIKPTMGSGSRGIKIIHSLEELDFLKGQLIYLENYLEGDHYNVYFLGKEICALKKPPLSDEHATMERIELTDDIKDYINKWIRTYNVPFGHLDLVREHSTKKLYAVDPGTFPEYSNWKCEGDPVSIIGDILLEKYKELKNQK